MTWTILFFGFVFGAILQYAKLNRFDTISGMAMLKDFTMAKAILIAIGIGIILISSEIATGLASYHVKPFVLGGIAIGGVIFGIGMAILGYCPGTLAISLGEGSIDAFVGIIGGLFSGFIYTLLVPSIKGILGPDMGEISLHSAIGSDSAGFFIIIFIIAAAFIGLSFWLNKLEKAKEYKWLYAGIALAVLNGIVFLSSLTDRIIGASTSYPYVADLLTGSTGNDYFAKIQKPGNWEMVFLSGAFISAVVISLLRKEFKLTVIHSNWLKYKGNSKTERLVWSFAGGFILIFGARMAGGCTSGHILSGGMQLAASSLVFAVFVFGGFLVTGKFFYRQ
jgi:uncharacterized protein